MKQIVFLLICILSSFILKAQPYTIAFNPSAQAPNKSASQTKGKVYHFSYPGVVFNEISTTKGIYNQMFVPGTYRTGLPGEPQLVCSQKLIQIPENANVSVRVIGYTTDDYVVADYFANNKFIPYQPSYAKSEDIQTKELIVKNDAYNRNAFSTSEIATIKVLGTLRDKRIAKLTVNPSAYNPVSNTLRFYNNIEVELVIENGTKASQATSVKGGSEYFASSYKKIESVLADTSYPGNTDLTKSPVTYLIIAPNNFIAGLQPFIKWKTQKGFRVLVGNLDSIGSTPSAIKTWVQGKYSAATAKNPAPSFLLLVGDVQQIPASQKGVKTGMATDLYYASVDGDMFPDMYYGRIPAQDTAQLRVMLEKTINYEKYKFANDAFLDNATLIAGADGTWNPRVAQPTIKYGTTNYFNTANGFNTVNAYLNSYAGCYSNDKASVSLINYTAHCSQTSWVTPALAASSAKTIGIAGQYTLAVGNCCQSGDFSIGECIGEAWVRNATAGAFAYLGSVPDTYWYEDFYWAVGAHSPVANQFPTVNGSSLGVYDALFGTEYYTVDAMAFVGNLAVTEAHNENFTSDVSSQYYWEAYHCLGDPAVIPYLKKGLTNAVTHDTDFHFGAPTFDVYALEGSTVALSNARGLIGTAIAGVTGIASIATDTVTLIDSVTLVVTKPKYKPYIKTLPVGEITGTYLVVEKNEINDATGNQNGKIDFGEQGNIQLTLKNIGNQTAQNVWVTITTIDTCIGTMTNNMKVPVGNIAGNSSIIISNAFNFKVKDFVPDQHQILFSIILSDSTPGLARNIYNASYQPLANAPKIEVLNYKVLDDISGNGNQFIDYGETVKLKLACINKGHAQLALDAVLTHASGIEALQINTQQVLISEKPVNDTIFLNFELQLPKTAPIKTADTLLLQVNGGQYQAQMQVILGIGQSLFAQLGTEKIATSDYPLNNYYKNNSTQILYRGVETGAGAKAITSMAFDVSKFTPNIAYRDLKNFSIKALITSQSELISKMDFTNSQTLYSNNMLVLPAVLGWQKFEFQNPIILDGVENIVFEISWGANDNFADKADRTIVNASLTPFKSVVWGAHDFTYPAPITAASNNRPNTQFEFDSIGILNLTVLGDKPIGSSSIVANCLVSKGLEVKRTNNQGKATFHFFEYSGNYFFNFSAYGYYDTTLTIAKTETYQQTAVQLRRHPELKIRIQNTFGLPIENASISIGTSTFTSNALGEVLSYSLPLQSYVVYSISKPGYYAVTDSILLNSVQKNVTITLTDKYSDVTVFVQNTKKAPLAAATVMLGSQWVVTDTNGVALFSSVVPGNYTVQLHRANYEYISQTLPIAIDSNNFLFTLKSVGKVLLNTNSQGVKIQDIEINFGTLVQNSNSIGQVVFNDVLEGTYGLHINDTNYYLFTDSVKVFGESTTVDIDLKNKADVTLYVNDGLVGLSNAAITFDTIKYITNQTGSVKLSNVNVGIHNYNANVVGYYPITDSISIVYTDTVINLKMNPIPDLVLEIKASVTDISKVPVYFENDTLYPNNAGYIELPDIGAGTFNYSINQTGFYALVDSVNLANINVKRVVQLIEIPDLKVYFNQNGQALDSVLFNINDKLLFSNSLGEVFVEDLGAGQYAFTATKKGCYIQNGIIIMADTNVVLNVELQAVPDLMFTVICAGKPVPNAIISIDTLSAITNALGQCTFIDLLANEYVYTITKTGYVNYTDSLTMGKLNFNEVVELQQPEYSAVFTVTNGVDALENAKIVFNKTEKLTNNNGITEFTNFIAGKKYIFTVSKDGFYNYTDSIVFIDKHLSIQIILQLKTYMVQFNVADTNGPVNGAKVVFNNHEITTNNFGLALFTEVVPANDISFYISKPETHLPDSGFINLTADTVFNIKLFVIPGSIVNESLMQVKLYPNPNHGEFFVDIDERLLGSEITITDNVGKSIYKGIFSKNPQLIRLQNSQGLYHLSIITQNIIIRQSIVVR